MLAVGSKRVTSIVAAAKELDSSGLPIQVVAVAGGDAGIYGQLKKTRWRIPAFIYDFVTEMPVFLRAADCGLSKFSIVERAWSL